MTLTSHIMVTINAGKVPYDIGVDDPGYPIAMYLEVRMYVNSKSAMKIEMPFRDADYQRAKVLYMNFWAGVHSTVRIG